MKIGKPIAIGLKRSTTGEDLREFNGDELS
jgi:hypothetical protein